MMPPTQLPAGMPVEWSKKAIASATLAIIGFITLWLGFGLFFAAIAAVLGHLARHDTAFNVLRGRRLAGFGVALGYISMLLFPLLAILISVSFPAFSKWRSDQDAQARASSQDNASRLFVACEAYARANKDRYPSDWEDLSGRFLPNEELAKLLKSPYPNGPEVAFKLVPHERPVMEGFGDSEIVIEEIAPPQVMEIVVVYANSNIATLHNPDYIEP